MQSNVLLVLGETEVGDEFLNGNRCATSLIVYYGNSHYMENG